MDLRSGIPYWLINDGLVRVYPPLNGDAQCDVAILGGGITGAMLAERLSREGASVIVLDKRDIGQGSTCASTTILQYEIDTELAELSERLGEEQAARCYRLGIEAIDELASLVASLPHDCGFARRPSLYRASRRSHVARLKTEFELRQRLGFDVEWWDAACLAETCFPSPAAIYSRGDAEADAYRLTHGVLSRAIDRGAQVFDRTTVTSVKPVGNDIHLHTDRGVVTCREVAYCTGYESAEHLPRSVGRLKTTYALATEPCGEIANWPERCVVWETARPYTYLRRTTDERIIIGGEDTPFSTDHQSNRLLARKTRRLQQKLSAMFPDQKPETAFAWAGVFGESEDGLPYIGSPPKLPHAWFALGYGGNGITFSVVAARILADLILGRPNKDAELFRFER